MVRNRPLITLLALMLALLAGCAAQTPTASSTSSPKPQVRIGALRGPTTMGLVKLMSDAQAGTTKNSYQVSVTGTADEVIPKIIKGEVDIALVPANIASVLYNRTQGKVQVADINTLGVLEVVEAGTTVSSIGDLRGRTIYSTGKGTTPEYVLTDLLLANGLNPATDVIVEYKSEAGELVAALQQKPDAVAVLPQPFVTTLQATSPQYRTALVLADEWTKVHPGSRMVTGVTIVRTQFAQEHPEAVRTFLAEHQKSTEFANQKPAEAAPLVVKAGIVPDAKLAEKAILACKIVHLTGTEAKSALSGYLEVLHKANPESIGGMVPGDDFYLGG